MWHYIERDLATEPWVAGLLLGVEWRLWLEGLFRDWLARGR